MADPHTPDKPTPAVTQALLSAVESGDAARVDELLGAGAFADAPSASGETPLMRAAAKGFAEVARSLVAAGADVNARRGDGFTPLVLAVFFGHEELVRLLLAHGADAGAQTRLGTTAERWAAARGFNRVSELLRGEEPAPLEAAPARRAEAARDAADIVDIIPDRNESPRREPVETEARIASTQPLKKTVAAPVVVRGRVDETSAGDYDLGAVAVEESDSDDDGAQARGAAARRAEFTFAGHASRPSHPAAGGFFSSWQAKAGAALLLIASGVAAYAAWFNARTRAVGQQATPTAATPAPQAVAPLPAAAVSTPSPLASPTPLLPDAQLQGMPAAVMPYPAAGQPVYVPPDPALSNAPQVPVVVSESGEAEDSARTNRRTDAASRGRDANNSSGGEQGREARADDTRPDATSRNPRPVGPESRPVQQPPPATPTPTPAERRKVIPWPPQR